RGRLIEACANTSRVLGRKDSNLRVADPKSAALPLGDSPEPGRSYRGYAPAAVDANASVAVSGVMTARTSHSWSTPRNSLGAPSGGWGPGRRAPPSPSQDQGRLRRVP